MKSFSKEEIADYFHRLRIGEKKLVLHSSLMQFAATNNVLNLIWELLNSNDFFHDSLVIPSYVLNNNREYCPYLSRPTIGAFPCYVFDLYKNQKINAFRSVTPLHNHIFIGQKPSESILDQSLSFGNNSDFDYLYQNDFKLVLLGTNFAQACTFIHHMEKVCSVPYRSDIELQYIIKDSHNVQNLPFKYFARTGSIETDFNKILPLISSCSSYVETSMHDVKSYSVDVRELYEVCYRILEEDPFYFLINNE